MCSKDGIVLGIETSCDETAAACVGRGREILSSVVSSQIDIHREFGGVVPEIASRRHVEAIIPVVDRALKEAQVKLAGIDAVAVTYGPGLVGALLVGLAAAKGLAFAAGIPLVCVNHIEGHIYANFLAHSRLDPPVLCLTVSGGHTELVAMPGHGQYEVLGRTRDDAAGEAFDKVARVMGLPYPGGPALEKLARSGDPGAVVFPRARVEGRPLDFSFSGLKTAVINYLHTEEQKGGRIDYPNVAAGFQKAVIDELVSRIEPAVRASGIQKLAVSGGVAANLALRGALGDLAAELGIEVFCPPLSLCTDNAAMIASAGYYGLAGGRVSGLDANAVPGARLEDAQSEGYGNLS
ncbi:MAG TPA: tRNA (adenosine(37)-N6)-threonylcarbamoyltransferase complex transferase subunit TsaD [Bacillota bacterium]|jgi:N6-L-threonylcarbamoyladenine synthase|nr:tRNA (adenosine(37)-N6)-threonylcarbamoyltransferase complex transferase subunit TsaD [Bacillota bacterium]